jgi:hypothetical protein
VEEQPRTPIEAGLTPFSVLPRFLVGDRAAIGVVANNRRMLLLGGLFCLSAGFAREYDGDDLLHEPWHLVIPLLASLATSFVLYCLLYLAALRRTEPRLAFGANYGRFLSLYWMTAPLAWLYALPVEQFLAPADAMLANLWLLAIVAFWRVALITRCASVLLGAGVVSVLVIVMLFADSLVQVILSYTPMPIFNIMGGIRLTESEALILGAALWVRVTGVATLPIWGLGALVVYASAKPKWTPLDPGVGVHARASKSLWCLAAAALLVWGAVLPYSQPPQQLKRRVEQALEREDVAAAVRLMTERDRSDFPASWNPPPWPGYGQDEPALSLVLTELIDSDIDGWVRDLYVEKLLQSIGSNPRWTFFWGSLDDEELRRYLKIFRAIPATRPTEGDRDYGISDVLEYRADEISEDRKGLYRELQKALLGLEGTSEQPADPTPGPE